MSALGKDGSPKLTLSLYCEYDSAAPWATLIGWLEPESWPPVRGPLLFKQVTLVEPPGRLQVPGAGVSGWYATYREKVSLVGLPLDTYLDCALLAGVGFAALTYDLHKSVGDRLAVDRGCLSVTRIPGTALHQIRALKLVAFNDLDEEDFDGIMCPVWADGVRAAAESNAPIAGSARTTEDPPELIAAALDPTALSLQWQTLREARRLHELVQRDGSIAFAAEFARGMAAEAERTFERAFAGLADDPARRFIRQLVPYMVLRAA